jgi:hypothetical protein
VVEHHGARAFEEHAVGLEARVVDHVLHAVLGLEQVQHVAAALAPAARGVHRVHGHVPARVGGEPVVGEHGVRRVALAPVLEQVHAHARGFEPRGGLRDFGMRLARRLCRGGMQRPGLEGVVVRGFRVGVKVVRTHHHDGAGGLDGSRCGHGGGWVQGRVWENFAGSPRQPIALELVKMLQNLPL